MRNYTHSQTRTPFWRIPEWQFTPGLLTCLLHYLKSYTERLEQGSFQSNRGANRRVGAWCMCVFRNRWTPSGITQTKIADFRIYLSHVRPKNQTAPPPISFLNKLFTLFYCVCNCHPHQSTLKRT
ncbi:hypothetical protein ATANTOWER_023262 [Ataeniobius toweri]|uniref:Uncharacterized protein n=1 Tax=Ataeniobius toweri TaxID=208326 RepID=A0ABU7BR73_9TELE|nr:hypothetical protein [Ataeniobius toweri]